MLPTGDLGEEIPAVTNVIIVTDNHSWKLMIRRVSQVDMKK